MKITEITKHIHELRRAANGKQPGQRLTWIELWDAAIACEINNIDTVIWSDELDLPEPYDGMFARLTGSDGAGDTGRIYIHRGHVGTAALEFVLCKELMHCWSDPSTRISTPEEIKAHAESFLRRDIATLAKTQDLLAILAAIDVMLPHQTIMRDLSRGISLAEIASANDLPPGLIEHLVKPDNQQILQTVDF